MEGFGHASKASPGELPKPECRPDDLLVRIAAAGVNPTDWKEIEGNLVNFYPPYAPRWAPGFDGAGIVEQTGSNVTGFAPGDRVVLMSDRRGGQCGTYAEYVRVAQHLVARAPASISLTETASIPVAGLTAYQALFLPDMADARAGQSILVHGASGGLGSFAVAFAHATGLDVAATCRAVNVDYVRGLGADVAIDYTVGDIVGATRRWMPQGIDIVLDCFSGGTQSELLDALAPGGRLVIIATVTDDADIGALSADAERRGLSIHFVILDHRTLGDDLRGIATLIDGGMKMPEVTVYPLDRAGEALAAMEAGKVRGKMVVQVADLG
jgi:NADPH:quinone reductase-like Zn-dependent oxidoreductase